MKRLYERAADGEQETFRRWCLQRAAPEDLAAHFAEAPPAAVVELATPQLCHSGAHLAQLVKRADGVAARAALAACHEEVAASLRDDKALCMQVARNAPVVVQRMLEVGADAVPEFVLKRPSMLQGVVKEQISRDPNWLPEICTDPDLFQSVVEANTGLLSVSLRRKRPMLIDYVKDPDSFESLCQLAEVTSSVMARMIASVRACPARATDAHASPTAPPPPAPPQSPVVFDELYEHHTSVMVGRVRESDTVVRDLCSDRTADCATWSLETLAEADPDLGLKGSTAAEVLDPFHLAVVPPRVEVAVQTQPPKAPAGFDLDKRSTVGDVPLHAVPAKPKKGKKSKAVKPQQLEGTVVADLLAQLVAAKIHADRADFERGRLTEHLVRARRGAGGPRVLPPPANMWCADCRRISSSPRCRPCTRARSTTSRSPPSACPWRPWIRERPPRRRCARAWAPLRRCRTTTTCAAPPSPVGALRRAHHSLRLSLPAWHCTRGGAGRSVWKRRSLYVEQALLHVRLRGAGSHHDHGRRTGLARAGRPHRAL